MTAFSGRRFARMLQPVLLAIASALAWAQAARAADVFQFDIPAEDLGTALRAFAKIAHQQIVFDSKRVQGLTSAPLSGNYTVEDALHVLLEPAGLALSKTAAGVYYVQSQSDDPAGANQTQVVGSDESLSEVLVTAQKRSERIQDVPIPVTVVDADNLADQNQVLFKDYYSSIPGVDLAPNLLGQQNIIIRGIGASSGAPTTGITVDDVPYGASTDWAGGGFLPDFDPGDLDHIEVLRGPQGTLYGANSEGGLVKFVTKRPSFEEFSGRIEAGTDNVYHGSEPGFDIRAAANIPVTSTLAVRISGYRRQDSGYIDNPALNLTGIGQTQAYGSRLSVLWQPSEAVSLLLGAMYQHDRVNGAPEVSIAPGLHDLQNNLLPGIEGDGDEKTVQVYSAVLKAKLGAGMELTSVSGYGINHAQPWYDYTAYAGAIAQQQFGVTGAPLYWDIPTDSLTQEIRLAATSGKSFDWLLGGFYKHDREHSASTVAAANAVTGQILGVTGYYTTVRSDAEGAAFADLTYHVTSRFDIQVGARETHDSLLVEPVAYHGPFYGPVPTFDLRHSSSTNTFTYMATPRLQISPDLMVYARFASGYRPGGINDNLGKAGGVPASYSPDKTQNYEIGAKGDFLERRLSLDTSIYYIDWQDIQINAFIPPGSYYNANGGSAKSAGVELSLEARPYSGLTVSSWIDYDNAVLTQDFPASSTVLGVSGDRLPFVGRFSARVSVEQQVALGKDANGFVGAAGSYIGDRLGPFTGDGIRQYLPGYTKIDLHAGVKYGSWTTTLYANNVADVRGLLNGGIGYLNPETRFYITPRTIGLSLVKTF